MSSNSPNQTTYNAILGRLLVGYRNELKFDQKQMAKALGLSQSSWSRMEIGETSVTVAQLGRISQLLGRGPDSILADVEIAKKRLEQMGYEVMLEKPKNPDMVVALVVGAALGLAMASILSRR